MRKLIQKKPRRSSNFYKSYFAAVFSGLGIGIFFALITGQSEIPDFETNVIKWLVWSFCLVGLLIFFYWIGIISSKDYTEKTVFHDNFLIGIVSSLSVVLLIIFNNLIRNSYLSLAITFSIFILAYFPFCYVYLKYSFPKSKD